MSLAGRDLLCLPYSSGVGSPTFPQMLVEKFKERKGRQSWVALGWGVEHTQPWKKKKPKGKEHRGAGNAFSR